jgi:hypothetical protein
VARGRFPVEFVFLIIGAGLLAGAIYAYDRIVVQPRSWPQAAALVVSSRVINPGGPDKYAPELVFRVDRGGSARDVTITPSWTSSSYAVVRSHIERFPAGRQIDVAVNPGNPGDLRYDLTLSAENLIVPGVLGLLGAVFAAIGALTLRGRRARAPAQPWDVPVDAGRVADQGARTARGVGLTFVLIGLLIAAIGAAMARSDLAMLRSWPQIEGRVVESHVVPVASRSSSRRGSNRPAYDTSVRFRYSVNDVTLENATTYGTGTSRSNAEARARAYAPGTVHRIWYRPDDPNLIRFDLDNTFSVFVLSGAMVLMGAIFMGLGGLVWRLSGRRLWSPDLPADQSS